MENHLETNTMEPQWVASVSEQEQAVFYKKTYLHVALAVCAFVIIEALFLNSPMIVEFMLSMTQGYLWLILLGAFWLATTMAERLSFHADKTMQYLGLGLFVIFEALIFVPLIFVAIYYTDSGYDLLNQAAIITLSLFTGLTAVVFMTRTDFSFLRTAITVSVFIAMGMIVAGIIFGFDLGLWFSFGMVVVAAMSILYQTSRLKNQYQTSQYVGASLGLFASLMLLFWYVLRIVMSRD